MDIMVIPSWLSCILNRNLCQRVQDFLTVNGHKIATSIEKSDAIIYAGCGVSCDTEMQSLKELLLVEEKIDIKNNKDKKIILIGCLPKQNEITKGAHFDSDNNYKETVIDKRYTSDPTSNYVIVDHYNYSLLNEIFNADIPFDNIPNPAKISSAHTAKSIYFSFKAMNDYPIKERLKLQNNFLKQAELQKKIIVNNFFYPSVADYLSAYGYNQIFIGMGCKNKCAYCAIKFARYKIASIPLEKIIARINELIEKGENKFVLLCQDMRSWGIDIEKNWIELLEALFNIDNPNLKFALFNVKAEDILEEKKFFDKAVSSGKISYIGAMNQHVNDRILKAMKRVPFNKEDYLNMINEYGDKNVHIHTYNIIGFPGETKDEFNELVDFIKEIKTENFSLLNFPYSDRLGTPAYYYDNKIPLDEIIKRTRIINDVFHDISVNRFSNMPDELKLSLITLIKLQADHTDLNQNFLYHLNDCI